MSELMTNSKASDRELAKRLGVSQPTVSRTRSKLEKEGYIREYAAIPDFDKLGFEIMAVSFFGFSGQPSEKKIEELRNIAKGLQTKMELPMIMAMSGRGLSSDRIVISLHEDYSAYSRFLRLVRQVSTQGIAKFESFVIDLKDKSHFQPLTMATLGKYLLKLK